MKKCLGCGVELQNENILNVGYTPNIDNNYCMRCFKVKNYGETTSIDKNDEDYIEILKKISKTKDLVVYVIDILNIRENLDDIREFIQNDVILVLNKRDILPKSVKEEKIVNRIQEKYNFLDIVVVSSLNNYNLDLLMSKIYKNKKSNDVYFIGETNAGKSSLINKIVGNYSEKIGDLTESFMPETTLDKIKIRLNDELTLIDTPGIVDNQNIINYVEKKYYKALNTKKEIRPKTFQIMKNQSIIIGDFFRIDYLEGDRNSFTFYVPNGIKVKRVSFRHDILRDLAYREFDLKFHEDLVIYGLGFIKIVINGKIGIYLNKDVKVFLRKNIIGAGNE